MDARLECAAANSGNTSKAFRYNLRGNSMSITEKHMFQYISDNYNLSLLILVIAVILVSISEINTVENGYCDYLGKRAK